jgi:serine protease Do
VAAFAAALLAVAGGARTEARAQYSRETPTVKAVRKTRAAIVTIKVDKSDAYEHTRETVGTGVVVDERGYIVTNRHVIADAVRVRVHLVDRTVWTARVVAEEPASDLAILRIRPERLLQALPLGPASDLMVGEPVIAVGHPYGYTNTVSDGIISAVGREITMPTGDVLQDLIQISAGINPGNSGGPLLNINGELIGINTALREGAQGIAFAINADAVKAFLSRHLSVVRVAGVSHGLTCAERVAPEGAQRQRVVVTAVAEETPAAVAGLQRGDEIRRVAERPVCNRFDLERALWGYQPGEHVTLTVVRQGKEMHVALTLARGAGGEHVTASSRSGPGDSATGTPVAGGDGDTPNRR